MEQGWRHSRAGVVTTLQGGMWGWETWGQGGIHAWGICQGSGLAWGRAQGVLFEGAGDVHTQAGSQEHKGQKD